MEKKSGRDLVDHHFAENGEEETRLAVGHGRRADVEIAAAHILLALDVQTRLEEAVVVVAADLAARRFGQQIGRLQSRLVRHVDGQLLQIGLIVAVRCRFICKK